MEFRILNYKSYKPVNVFHMRANNVIQAIYTFVGNPPTEIREAISDYDKKKLEKYYGSDYNKILGFNILPRSRSSSDLFSSDEEFESLPSDTPVQIETNVIKGHTFIYDYLNDNDNILGVKQKIFIYSKIPVVSQHLWTSEGTLGYSIYNISGKLQKVNTNIQMYSSELINVKNYIIKNKDYTLLGPTREIKLADFRNYDLEILNQDLGYLYENYILKYFPAINNYSIKSLLNNTYQSVPSLVVLQKEWTLFQKQINEIKGYTVQEHAIEVNVNSIILHINYPDEINLSKDFIQRDTLILKNIFTLFETNHEIPFIKLISGNKIVFKINKQFYNDNNNLIYKWKNTKESFGLVFKLRFINKFINVILYSDGKMEVKTTIPSNEYSITRSVNEIKSRIESLVNVINGLKDITIQPFNKLLIYKIKVVSINSSWVTQFNFNVNYFIKLQAFINKFNYFIIPDHELQRSHMSVIMRYINKSFMNTEKIKKGGNEMVGTFVNNQFGSLIEINGSPAIIKIKSAGNFENTLEMINFIYRFIKIFFASEGELNQEDTSESNKRIKKLKMLDSKTFDFKSDKYDPYSRKCLQKTQPLVFTDSEFDKIKIKYKSENVLRVKNKSDPGKFLNYVCDDPEFQFPGFIGKDLHPEGICMPCCYRSNSRILVGQKKNKKFEQCIKLENNEFISDTNFNNRGYNYITNWKHAEITPGRYSKLPSLLYRFFEKIPCEIKNNILNNDTECLLIPGIYQTYDSFLTAVSLCFNENLTSFDLLERIKKQEYLTGLVNIDLVEYLSTEKTFSDIILVNLLSFIYNCAIVVFNTTEDDINISCTSIDSINNLNTILIIKVVKSDLITHYHPIWFINHSEIQKYFTNSDLIIKVVTNALKNVCKESYILGDQIDIFNLKQIANITGQVLDSEGIPEYANINNSFSFPVKKTIKLSGIPAQKIIRGKIGDIKEFLSELDKGIHVSDIRIIESGNIIGYLLNTKQFIPTIIEKTSGITDNDIIIKNHNPINVEKTHNKIVEDDFQRRNEYFTTIEKLSTRINEEKNTKVREIILGIKNGDFEKLSERISKQSERISISEDDISELKSLYYIANNSQISFKTLLDTTRFNFDTHLKQKIIKLISEKNSAEIKKIISKYISKFIDRITDELIYNDYQRLKILEGIEKIVYKEPNKNEIILTEFST